MKKITFLIILAAAVGVSSCGLFKKSSIDSQQPKNEKSFADEFNDESIARSEAKKLRAQGFDNAPGDDPIELQIYNFRKKTKEKNENGLPVWFTGKATADSPIRQNAILAANAQARANLASKLEAEYRGVIETKIRNNEIAKNQQEAFNKVVSVGIERTVAKLTLVTTDIELVRDNGSSYQCYIQLSFNADAVRKELQKQLDQLKGEADTRELESKNIDLLYPDKVNLKGDVEVD